MLTNIFSTLLITSAVSAVSITPAMKRDDPGPTIWTSPDGGNTKVRFGDDKVYVGSCTPESILNTVYENCYEEGFCNSAAWTMQCTQSDGGTHTITISAPEGQYQTWIRNGLVDAFKAAVGTEGVVEKDTIWSATGGGCTGCPWTGQDVDVYKMPGTMGIAHNNDGTVPDVITLNIVNNDDEDDAGLCEILTGIGNGLAGSINGAAGGIFQLGSVACKAI